LIQQAKRDAKIKILKAVQERLMTKLKMIGDEEGFNTVRLEGSKVSKRPKTAKRAPSHGDNFRKFSKTSRKMGNPNFYK